MSTMSKKKGVLAALVMFGLVIVMLYFVATPIQMYLGMWGVLLTELILLAMAVGGALIMKEPFREVFPVHIPHIRQIFGTLLIWVSGFLLTLFSTLLVGYFFPDQMGATGESINGVVASVAFPIRFLIIAVSPAICEEAVHRGFILHHIKPLGKKWLIVLIGGVLFGLFHMDPMRFLGTGILGAVITYAVLETDNMFYGFLIHFVNNTLSVLASLMVEQVEVAADTSAQAFSLSVVGMYMILICVVPWTLWAGTALLKPKTAEKKKFNVKRLIISIVISIVCLVGGGALFVGGLTQEGMATTGVQNPTVAELVQEPYSIDLEIRPNTRQQMTAVLATPKGVLHVSIIDDEENVAYEFTAQEMTGNVPLNLEAGHYTLQVDLQELEEEEKNSDEVITFQLIIVQM